MTLRLWAEVPDAERERWDSPVPPADPRCAAAVEWYGWRGHWHQCANRTNGRTALCAAHWRVAHRVVVNAGCPGWDQPPRATWRTPGGGSRGVCAACGRETTFWRGSQRLARHGSERRVNV